MNTRPIPIKLKIARRLDELEDMLRRGDHLREECRDGVIEKVQSILKFYSYLGWDDREFITLARYAINDRTEWK